MVVVLDAKGFAVRAEELRELGRNPRKDMSAQSSQTISQRSEVLLLWSAGEVNSTVLFALFLLLCDLPMSPSSLRFCSIGPCFEWWWGMVDWLRLPDKEV
jgi:hypothetical protein